MNIKSGNYGSRLFNQLVKKSIHDIDEMLKLTPMSYGRAEELPPQSADLIIRTVRW
jgi:hypothetical protein